VSPVAPVLERLRALAPDVTVEATSSNDPLRFEPPQGEPTAVVPFNTDASYLAPIGPVWLGGPGAIEVAHSSDEHLTREQLLLGVELYVRLAERALA
ncbi:M20/M25/M40 family metallo-hydrolase, partial [bacterium]|nr:M20/M25/M40 family metallo-hydrolase [bacterium]